jgi:hypothetical protein
MGKKDEIKANTRVELFSFKVIKYKYISHNFTFSFAVKILTIHTSCGTKQNTAIVTYTIQQALHVSYSPPSQFKHQYNWGPKETPWRRLSVIKSYYKQCP